MLMGIVRNCGTRMFKVGYVGAAVLLLILAVVAFGYDGTSAQAQSPDMETARYEMTFTGLFEADALATDAEVPGNANFKKDRRQLAQRQRLPLERRGWRERGHEGSGGTR